MSKISQNHSKHKKIYPTTTMSPLDRLRMEQFKKKFHVLQGGADRKRMALFLCILLFLFVLCIFLIYFISNYVTVVTIAEYINFYI